MPYTNHTLGYWMQIFKLRRQTTRVVYLDVWMIGDLEKSECRPVTKITSCYQREQRQSITGPADH